MNVICVVQRVTSVVGITIFIVPIRKVERATVPEREWRCQPVMDQIALLKSILREVLKTWEG